MVTKERTRSDESGEYGWQNIEAVADAVVALRRIDHDDARDDVSAAALNARQDLEPVLTEFALESLSVR